MSNQLKKHGFLPSLPRLFTREDPDALDLIHFREPDGVDGEVFLACPDNWSNEAAELLAEHAVKDGIPSVLHTIEENTVPSWLWRRVADTKGTQNENSAIQIFTRVAGSAAYIGWKLDLFANEYEARNFYDEVRYALAQRFIAIEPGALKELGIEWAYGIRSDAKNIVVQSSPHKISIENSAIDALVGGNAKQLPNKWHKYLHPKTSQAPLAIEFSDIAADWGIAQKQGPHASIDLMACRHNDGTVNIETLQHMVRLAVLLLDLHGERTEGFTVGFHNLAPLLMALALPYDSEAGRSMAGSISALVSAEAYAMSAILAGLLGASFDYTAKHDVVLRAIRNHRRAAYGDKSDYEKISVIPASLKLGECPDLPLAAAAQHHWDEALDMAKQYGLRHLSPTALTSSPEMILFTESTAQGVTPIASLTVDGEIAPYVHEALARLRYEGSTAKMMAAYIRGTHTLDKAPGINHAALKKRGFDAAAIAEIEEYLPQINDIRLAFTPYILGTDFCRKVLRIPTAKLQNARFDMLKHLGFDAKDVAAANAHYYGHGSVQGAKMSAKHAGIFARANEISSEAKIGMAASVQSFVAGNVDLDLTLAGHGRENGEKLILSAWRQGLKGIRISFDTTDGPAAKTKKAKSKVSAFLHTKPPSLPVRKASHKAGSRIVIHSRHTKQQIRTKGR